MRNQVNISINWLEKLQFSATNDRTDAEFMISVPGADDTGGPSGTGPKHVFLQGLASCTGGAVLFLLGRMKAEMPSKFMVDVAGKLTSEHPMYFETIDITYRVEGNTDAEMIRKAAQMSQDKYCGLTHMLSDMAKITVNIILNGDVVEM